MSWMKVKKLDQMMLKSFIQPFVLTFVISIFVLVMQGLWNHIDDIAGKGVNFFEILELFGYMCISMFPMALPVAILISSVMVFGNMAEFYELSSIKSAGISLLRCMKMFIFSGAFLALFSYLCSDYIIPTTNLQFKSRLYDIKNQKPTLSLDEGVFNDDFRGFSIRIGSKGRDGESLGEVMIVDHNQSSNGVMMEIVAERGQMYVTDDERYMVMELYDGVQYQQEKKKAGKDPFVRIHFDTLKKIFDLSEFDLKKTDPNAFQGHHSMLSVNELLMMIDTVEKAQIKRVDILRDAAKNSIFYSEVKKQEEVKAKRELANQKDSLALDSLGIKDSILVDSTTAIKEVSESKPKVNPSSKTSSKQQDRRQSAQQKRTRSYVRKPHTRVNMDSLASLPFIYTFKPDDRSGIMTKAKSLARSIQSQSKSTSNRLADKKDRKIRFAFQLHSKLSLAVSCLLFIFVGVPMGAIVRKGGFGYPLIVSILIFILFNMILILGKNLSRNYVISPELGAWLPCIVLIPIGAFLTYMAMNDRKLSIQIKLPEGLKKKLKLK